MDPGNDLIHEWLANVTNDLNFPQDLLVQNTKFNEQQTSGPRRIDDRVALDAPGLVEDFTIAAKIYQATTKDPGHGTTAVDDRRTQEGLMGVEEGLDLLPKGKKRKREDTFQRRPRHKTREDFYEYKGSTVGNQQQSSSKFRTRKRKRPSRWHNMNDEFHASNVARERLTLRSNMNVGIFNKGKASSPVILRDGKLSGSGGLANELSMNQGVPVTRHIHMPTVNDADRKTVKRRKKGHIRQEKSQKYTFAEPLKEVEVETVLPPKENDPESRARETSNDAYKAMPSSRIGVELLAPATCKNPKDTLPQSKRQVQDPVDDAQSSIPYTWSDTHHDKSETGHELEVLLLKGLLSTEIADCSVERVPATPYCDLDELQKLLRERKSFWQCETNQNFQVDDQLLKEIPQRIGNRRFTETQRSPEEGTAPNYSTDLKPHPVGHVKSFHVSDGAVENTAEFIQTVHDQRDTSSFPESTKRFMQHGLEPDVSLGNRHEYTASASIDADLLVEISHDMENYPLAFQDDDAWKEFEWTTEDLLAAFPVNEPPGAVSAEHALLLGERDRGGAEGQSKMCEKAENLEFLPQLLGEDVFSLLSIPRHSDVQSAATHGPAPNTLPPGFWRQNRLY
ncbi:hypothetical protein N7478_002146 [Penicillium angulare]|uniref:uncharacterized protein n=1 Tax=Penicillium angulare TaxID=116970 RepID=UPI002540F749|nr:uncharacterized protein N7478_002146 [Penicillium angulare]KAJ5289116.1 hypothetical protein N7478_002146 [Penicillium angulare]